MTTSLNNAKKTRIVAEALSYVQRYSGKTVVIKYGGNAMTNSKLQTAFAEDVIWLKMVGIHPVIVHGGGPQINEMLQKIGKESHFVEGLRYTDKETMNVVEMVLGGLINQDIVGLINQQGGKAVGLTGKDGGLIRAKKTFLRQKNKQKKDIGLVGEVTGINTKILSVLESAEFIPVIAPISVDEKGETLNINADTVAAELAVALDAQALFLLTNTAGVLDKKGEALSEISVRSAKRLISTGVIAGGMRPKVECAIHAVSNGVASCQIINGEAEHALLLELFTNEGAGTFISR
ncbi:MAG: acetylglutamate kinase [Proteobacteria bacterium]|nr:acetylglutamate kinase [Pseudomonadota bacterium]MCH9758562.1 acetylglutamate kinase [Pseudomonadota bacterium]